MVNLYDCPCLHDPRADPANCSAACPNVYRYKGVVPSDQVALLTAWNNAERNRAEVPPQGIVPSNQVQNRAESHGSESAWNLTELLGEGAQSGA